jgi:RNA polymerase sigma factor (TIGR02999 family)
MVEEEPEIHGVTRILRRMEAGDGEAQDELLPLVYGDLLRIARRRTPDTPGATLQPTALVNEAWLKLARAGASWKDRQHFLTAAAQAMRQILVDHARTKAALKRDARRVELEFLDGVQLEYEAAGTDLVALDEHLGVLRAADPGLAQVVDLRFFAGLQHQEIAELLDVTTRTIERRWQLARGWLRERMGPSM